MDKSEVISRRVDCANVNLANSQGLGDENAGCVEMQEIQMDDGEWYIHLHVRNVIHVM